MKRNNLSEKIVFCLALSLSVYLLLAQPTYSQEDEKPTTPKSNDEKMESISATAFDISESLGLSLMLADFDPEGDFESKKMIIEHYETLTHIFNMKIDIEQKVANPIRELSSMQDILQVAPFEKPRISTFGF